MTRSTRRLAAALGLLAVVVGAACDRKSTSNSLAEVGSNSAPRVVDTDPRPFTPWHRRDEPLPFSKVDWYWQEEFAFAPDPEPLPSDPAAAARLKAAFERIATSSVLQSEEELPAMLLDARADPAALFAALDDRRRDVHFAAARLLLRLICAKESGGCPFPRQVVQAAAKHLRDSEDECTLLHLETIARSGFAWTQPLLLKTFGKVDNHRYTVLRIRAAAKLALARCYGGMAVMIKALKENTSIQDDVNREWDFSLQTAWWKEEAMAAIRTLAGTDFGHSPDASDADQVAAVRKVEAWWRDNHVRLWAESPEITDPELIERIHRMILGFGTFQIRNVDNAGFILAGLGPKVAPWLFEALAGSSFMVRRHVLAVIANLIGEIPESERSVWIGRVASSLRDPDPAIRVRALEVIGASRLPEAQAFLEKALAPGDVELQEAAMRQLAAQDTGAARGALERLASNLPPGHSLMIPLQAARLAAGDLAPLDSYMKLLSGEKGPDPRARMYLSWIVESDGLADAKTPEEQRRALAQVETEIRARASSGSRSSR